MKKFLYSLLVLIILFVILLTFSQRTVNNTKVLSTTSPSVNNSVCKSINDLPDKNCTPGEIDTRVTQENIYQTICVKGYTKTVRPPVSYTEPLKLKIMKEYGYLDSPKNYEFDHLIPLEVGGNPISEKNLWPEHYALPDGSYQKDKVENYLNSQVCKGKIPLDTAQKEIANDWISVYNKISSN